MARFNSLPNFLAIWYLTPNQILAKCITINVQSLATFKLPPQEVWSGERKGCVAKTGGGAYM